MSIMAPSVSVCETGGGGGGAVEKDTATGEGSADGIVGGGWMSLLSKGVELAIAVPGFRMGNSSSSSGFGMGIGPEMRPRTDWWPVLGLAVVGEAGVLPKILAFIVSSTAVLGLTLRAARGKVRKDDEEDVSMAGMWEVEDGDGPSGLSEPSGITIKGRDGVTSPSSGFFAGRRRAVRCGAVAVL